jgi:diguanylate cyclase (GGDEF)-like protein
VNAAQPPLDQNRLTVAVPLEPSTEVRLVEDARRRTGSRLYGRDQLTTLASGLGFLATALTIRATADVGTGPSLGLIALLIVSYAVLSRIEFELGSGTVLPTELVLVPMLFLVPAAEVPLLVALAFILGGLPDMLRGRLHAERVFVRLAYSWHSIGPVTVFLIATPGAPSWSDWPIYVLALGAQFALDLASSMGREWLGVGVPPSVLAPVLVRVYLVDLLLAPIGFLAAMSAVEHPLGFLPVLGLAALLALIATDRRERIGETIVLTDAFESASTVARVDALTGLANRLAWEEYVNALATAQNEDGRPVSIIVVDLDGLKLANDTHGHAFGDTLIRAAAHLVDRCVGTSGFVARLSGDEIGVAVMADPRACAALVARLETDVRSHPPIDGFPLSLSLGAGTSPPEPTLSDAFAEADRQMYAEKRRSGRSRTAVDRVAGSL